MSGGLIRRWTVVVTAACALVIVFVPSGQGAATPINFRVTLHGTITGGLGDCCFSETFSEGTGVVPHIGAASFTGFTLQGCHFAATGCLRAVTVDIVGRSGSTLTLSEWANWPYGETGPPATWVAGGSGFSGSGTYEVTFVPQQPEVTFTFAGTLHNS